MSNRPERDHDLPPDEGPLAADRSSLEEPARPARVGSGMFLPALIVLAIAIVVILFFALR